MRLRAFLVTIGFCAALPAMADDMRRVTGQIMLLERLAVPETTIILVDVSTANDTPLMGERRPTDGQQSPFAYDIEVPADQDLILRVGLRAADEVFWLSEPKRIPAGAQPLDLGTVRALRLPQMGFAALYGCGNTLIELGVLPETTRVRVNERVLDMQPQPAASGSLYVDPSNPATSIHMKGDTALLRVDGAELSECARLQPETDFTQGVWNISAIEGQPTVFPSRTELVFFMDGRASATLGCNRFIGSYRRHGGVMSFGAVATTMMACPDGMNEQEALFGAALARIDGYSLNAETGRLSLTAEGQTVVQARK